MISINSTVRFPSLAALKRKATSLRWIGFKHAEDARGFYVTEVELDPKEAAWLEAQDAKVREARAARGEPEITRPKERAPRPVNEDGPVHRIRRWARENVNATPADAVAHFADLHPATVKIQLRKVRKGEV